MRRQWLVLLWVAGCSFDSTLPGSDGDGSGSSGAASTGDDVGDDSSSTSSGADGSDTTDDSTTDGPPIDGSTTDASTDDGSSSSGGPQDSSSTESSGSSDDESSESSESSDTGTASEWVERRRISSSLAEPLAESFAAPVLVLLDDDRIDYGLAHPEGADLRFSDAQGTPLPHEVERWNPEGVSRVWVRMPAVSGPEAWMWMAYGNPEATSVEDPAAVWSDGYVGVWHLAGNVDADAVLDSSPAANHGTITGDVSEADGEWGPAFRFGGEGAAVVVPDADSLDVPDGLTLEGWVESEIVDDELQRFVVLKDQSYLLHATTLWTQWPYFFLRIESGWWGRGLGYDFDLSPHFLAGTYERQTSMLRFYDQGQQVVDRDLTGDVGTSEVVSSDADLRIGENLQGLLYEVRISDHPRSATWLDVQDRSMRDALLVYGPPEAL